MTWTSKGIQSRVNRKAQELANANIAGDGELVVVPGGKSKKKTASVRVTVKKVSKGEVGRTAIRVAAGNWEAAKVGIAEGIARGKHYTETGVSKGKAPAETLAAIQEQWDAMCAADSEIQRSFEEVLLQKAAAKRVSRQVKITFGGVNAGTVTASAVKTLADAGFYSKEAVEEMLISGDLTKGKELTLETFLPLVKDETEAVSVAA